MANSGLSVAGWGLSEAGWGLSEAGSSFLEAGSVLSEGSPSLSRAGSNFSVTRSYVSGAKVSHRCRGFSENRQAAEQILPVFYRTLSPQVPSGTAARLTFTGTGYW